MTLQLTERERERQRQRERGVSGRTFSSSNFFSLCAQLSKILASFKLSRLLINIKVEVALADYRTAYQLIEVTRLCRTPVVIDRGKCELHNNKKKSNFYLRMPKR